MPTTLDYAGLSATREAHVQGTYALPDGATQAVIAINTVTPSLLRFKLEPVTTGTVRAVVQRGTAVELTALSAPGQVLAGQIAAGTHTLTLTLSGFTAVQCNTITMELAVTPTDTINGRFSVFTCPAQEVFPDIPFSDLVNTNAVHYDSSSDPTALYNVQAQVATIIKKSYNFTVPQTSTHVWEFSARLGYNFPTGGFLGLGLSRGSTMLTTTQCYQDGNCTLGTNAAKNTHQLYTTLAAGDYTLMIYTSGVESPVLGACSPFTLAVDLTPSTSDENFFSCQGYPFPTTLDEPGYISPSGYLFFKRSVIMDLANTQHTIQFSAPEESYIRVYTGYHRVDIDFRLTDITTGTVVAYAYRTRGPEGITTKLVASHSYTLTLLYYGTYEYVFCETFDLEISIIPIAAYASLNYCDGHTEEIPPSLVGMANLSTTLSYHLETPVQPYYHIYNNAWNYAKFLTQQFDVTVKSHITVEVDANFVLGDIMPILRSGPTAIYGDHNANRHFLVADLTPGSYTLELRTAPMQSSGEVVTLLPCSPYNLLVDVVTIADATDAEIDCPETRLFPATLNTPDFLGTSPHVHFVEEFLIPLTGTQTFAVRQSTLQVIKQSILRIFSGPEHIDLDYYLKQNGTTVARSRNQFNEEVMVALLEPNQLYTLETRYYHWIASGDHSNDPLCFTYEVEMAIVPEEENFLPGCDNHMPPADLFPSAIPDSGVFSHQGVYFFQQGQDPLVHQLTLTVNDWVTFRAALFFDFVWDHIVVTISGGTLASTVMGSIALDTNALPSLTLGPGTYTVVIAEPYDQDNLANYELSQCVTFTFQVGYEQLSHEADPENFNACPYLTLPPTFNTIAALHTISGNQMYLSMNVKPNSVTKDEVEVTIGESSLVRVYLPPHDLLDIDVWFRRGSKAAPGDTVDRRTTRGEEAMFLVVEPGNYLFQFYYYGMGTTVADLPTCTIYSMQLAISPASYWTAIADYSTPCTTEYLPASLAQNTSYSSTIRHSLLDATHYSSSVNVYLTAAARLTADFTFDFVPGGLSVLLSGRTKYDMTYIDVSYYNNLGYDHIFIDEILFPGNYTLTLHDASTSATPNTLSCSSYKAVITTNTNVQITPSMCLDVEKLPTDLYTTEGGSIPYGGPQSTYDASVRIFGTHFYMTRDSADRNKYISFKVLQPSFVRAFARTTGLNDIDVYLYGNRSDPGTLVGSSLGVDEMESALWTVNPQNVLAPYDLRVSIFRTDSSFTCNYFHFEFALKTVSTVQRQIVCGTLPPEEQRVPPADITNPSTYYEISSDNYVFTKAFVESHTSRNLFRYRMALQITGANVSLVSNMRYDFLINEYVLYLRSQSGQLLVHGLSDGSYNRGSYYNFINTLQYKLDAGQYYLDIEEKASTKNLTTGDYCYKFAFDIVLERAALNPEIIAVEPPQLSEVEPCEDLYIEVEFSEPVKSVDNLLVFINTQECVYLSQRGSTAVLLHPSDATLSDGRNMLAVKFSKGLLSLGVTYQLRLKPEAFTTDTGVPFTNPDSADHTYSMVGCNCAHGTCVFPGISSCVECRCQGGWTGDKCDTCPASYHIVGNNCVQSQPCTATTCNGNGACDDSLGQPICTCYEGYATSGDNFCSVCAYGYSGFPNCVADSSEPRYCDAPLLPEDLDTVAYLGYTGSMHVAGDFFMDASGYHNTYFSLTQSTAFRIYCEPHDIDIDLWLFTVDDSGVVLDVVDYRVSFNSEETIYRVLPGGTTGAPLRYMLKFRFYVWGTKAVSDCPTFTLELEMQPAQQLAQEVRTYVTPLCGTAGVLPQIPFTDVTDNVAYQPTTFFSVASQDASPHYFFNHTFTIFEKPGMLAVINAEVGYRFLPGDLALLLEEGGGQTHCGSGYGSACTTGTNQYNSNFFASALTPGTYTLWMYEPAKQDSSISLCSVFEFSLSIKYVPVTDDLWDCDGVQLPRSLNYPGYLNADGRLYITDTFAMTSSNVTFTLAATSVLRIAAPIDGGVRFGVYNGATWVASSSTSELLVQLDAGQYSLTFNLPAFGNPYCPLVKLELAIEPVTLLGNRCDDYPTVNLPTFDVVTVPYYLGPTADSREPPIYSTTPYSSTGGSVLTVSIRVGEKAILSSSVLQSFLLHDARLKLTGSTGTVWGTRNYNSNNLVATLEVGTYTLTVERSPLSRPASLPSCLLFNFILKLSPFTETTQCLLTGEIAPLSLNTERFLNNANRVSFSAENFNVPTGVALRTKETITFSVEQLSVFRVYTEPNSEVDIDTKLLDGTGTLVASGSNGIYTEESFSFEAAPGSYTLEIWYWFWTTEVPACPTYRMQLSLTPPASAACPTAFHWPPSPPSALHLPSTPYTYSSTLVGESLYLEEVQDESASNTLRFTLEDAGNVFAQTEFDFSLGHLALRLEDSRGMVVSYSVGSLNRNTLSATNLPSGTYSIVIYEPSADYTPSSGNCLWFSFTLLVEQQSQLYSQFNTLPANLDGIPFLFFGNHLHIFGAYRMFESANNESCTFTLKSPSLVRITAQLYEAEAVQTVGFDIVNVAGKTAYTTATAQVLPAGATRLTFKQPDMSVVRGEGIVVLVEVAIETTDAVYNRITTIPQEATCSDQLLPRITVDPNGFYQYHSDTRCISFDTLQASRVVQQQSFSVTQDAVVAFELQFDFVLAHLASRLTNDITGDVIFGTIDKNINSVLQVVSPGNYTVSIEQPSQLTLAQLPNSQRCTPFTASLTISRNYSDHIDCTWLDPLPWDLNRQDGGSALFGGPIDARGVLELYGASFIIPDTRSSDTMTFTLSEPSVISVFVTTATTVYSARITLKASAGTVIVPDAVKENVYLQQTLDFWVYPTGSETYTLTFDYGYRFGKCSSMELQLLIYPTVVLHPELVCPSPVDARMPSSPLAVDPQGFAQEYMSSYIPSNTFAGMASSGTGFVVSIVVTQSLSYLDVSFSYSSLVNVFAMSLVTKRPSGLSYTVANGKWATQSTMPGITTLTLDLSTDLTPGNYTLLIKPANWTGPYEPSSTRQLCYPFLYEAMLVPLNGAPFVAKVVPEDLVDYDLTKDLVVEIHFSKAIYGSPGLPATSSLVVSAFYLQAGEDTAHPVSPSSATQSAQNNLAWTLTFDKTALLSGTQYRLYMQHILYDSSNQLVRFTSYNFYTMLDTTCNGHGTLVNSSCMCDVGYAGDACQVCDEGYNNIGEDKLQCISETICQEDTCGCKFGSDGYTCIPLGTCSVGADSKAHCQCNDGYTGDYCTACLDGYGSYPYCSKCKHGGNWSEADQKCLCLKNYAGKYCDDCAKGHTGGDCHKRNNSVVVTVVISVLLLITSVVLGGIGIFLYRKFSLNKMRYSMVPQLGINTVDEDLIDTLGEVHQPSMNFEAPHGDEASVIAAAVMPNVADKDKASTATTTTSTTAAPTQSLFPPESLDGSAPTTTTDNTVDSTAPIPTPNLFGDSTEDFFAKKDETIPTLPPPPGDKKL
eukprot:TRINITY_DN18721_c0_g1_i1.p1 TRINITY_DN18721_c0_g1~~TRINITY_DN18721_c0_g1_i1.p1  ORF type:complete len:3503 (-),score=850.93 TRINITY_DN18721_c0_g1_i1:100-10434(-)